MGTAHLELSGLCGEGTLTVGVAPRGAGVLPSVAQSATGTLTPPTVRPGERPSVGSFALTMAAVVAASASFAAYGAKHDTAGSLGALCALIVILRSLPRD